MEQTITTAVSDQTVRHFREVLLWPVQLMPVRGGAGAAPHWELLAQQETDNPWRMLDDRFDSETLPFEERHYNEFVAFLPYVQRLLYGECRGRMSHDATDIPGRSAIRIFRRHGVAALRLTLRRNEAPFILTVEHIELWFFEDINVTFLKLELSGADLPFAQVCDLLYRSGRAYPTGWDEEGHAKHNVHRAEWLSADGEVLAVSDSGNRKKFLSYSRQHRSSGVSAHWDFLMRPLVLDPSEEHGILRYRHIEYHRMPLMAFLSLDNPRGMSRENWLRLGLAATLHPDEALPTHDPDVADFEARYCYDRFWADTGQADTTRFICTGRTFIVAGNANESYFHDRTHGVLAQFRHQYVLMFMIAHFHRASLLAFSERLVDAVHDLDIRLPQSLSRFRRRVYAGFEAFLRFTHRYWFHELSERGHVQALFRLCSNHLGNDELYLEVKDELRDMSQYLDSNIQRQQSTTIVRLTVVTVFSMVGTVSAGLLGMNLIDETTAPLSVRVIYFLVTLLVTALFVTLAIFKSKQLSDVMDVLADDQKNLRTRLSSLGSVWRRNLPKP